MQNIQDELLDVLKRHREKNIAANPPVPQWEDSVDKDLTEETQPDIVE